MSPIPKKKRCLFFQRQKYAWRRKLCRYFFMHFSSYFLASSFCSEVACYQVEFFNPISLRTFLCMVCSCVVLSANAWTVAASPRASDRTRNSSICCPCCAVEAAFANIFSARSHSRVESCRSLWELSKKNCLYISLFVRQSPKYTRYSSCCN